MRVAALYDIHGNLPALEAVLRELEDSGADAIVVGGDVAAGPMPRETIARLRALDGAVHFVCGNADRGLFGWALEQLRPPERDFLAGFGEPVALEVDGLGPTLFCHGSPRSDEEILTSATSEGRLRRILDGVEEDIVVCGHTHVQFDRRLDRRRVINAGSVGMPYEERPGAYWALLGPDVELRRTEYDLERAAEAIRATGWPGAEEFVAENLLTVPSADEATAYFERLALEREAGLSSKP